MIISLGKDWNTYSLEDDLVAQSGMRYEIGDKIDRGGNAAVHECINDEGSTFAVKFLLQTYDRNRRRFEQEIKALSQIHHPHIVQYIDHGSVSLVNNKGEENIIMFLIMEKADSNLLEYMKTHKTIGYEIYAPQFRGLCEVLMLLHRFAIHRDIKPENILVKGETWKLSDLGLCSYLDGDEHQDITRDNEKIGPKFWLSPEAINRYYFSTEEIGTFSDVYQLCAVFWFVLTLRHPTGILSSTDWYDCEPRIYDVLFKSLTHDLHRRPQNGAELHTLMCQATLSVEV